MSEVSEGKVVNFSELCKFQPKQIEAAKAARDFRFLFFGGAVGGGKSYFLRWYAIRLLLYYASKYNAKGVRVGLFCEDYPALKERHLSKVQYEFPDWLGTLNKSEHEFVLAPRFGSGVLAFRNLDDPSKYLSSEFAAELVDELTKNDRETFEFLMMRLRWPGIPDTRFIAASNPGGKGHAWVKKLWLDRDFEGETFDPKDFKFIQSKVQDNKFLGPEYLKTLEGLPEDKRKAYLEGDWDLFKGQFFTEFRRERHVMEPFAIPNTWKRIRCLDYGQLRPSAVYWLAIDHDGRIYVYRELYETGHTYKTLAQRIGEMTPNVEKIDYTSADPAVFAKTNESARDGDEIFYEEGVPIDPANNNRILGWDLFRDYLRNDMIKFFSTCTQAIRTIPSLVYSARGNPEDLDSDGDDHAADSIRYGLMSRPPLTDQQRQTNTPDNPYQNDPDSPWFNKDEEFNFNNLYSNG